MMLQRYMLRALLLAPLIAVTLALLPSAAFAHVGDHSAMGFTEGFVHPFTGLDHMLAMIAVGLWASQLGRPALYILPVAFPAAMAIGAAIGIGGSEFSLIEIGIAGSVLGLGILVALALRVPLYASVGLIGVFALLHGYSHGATMPAQASIGSFAAGFVLATLCLHAIGIAIGLLAEKRQLRYAARVAGCAIAAIGVFLLATI